ncbi:MAG: redoxin domain-containing protein [Planctomycetaceae bacterium]|nr:redoxin domain-containing protein [Planctomycetaceae bacterium]
MHFPISRSLERFTVAAALALLFSLAFASRGFAQTAVELKVAAPELEERPEEEWINSKPLKLADLRGQVVVLHFWTFGCINCIHNQPHYKSWHKKYSKKGLTVIGVHTPETEGERDIEAVRKSAEEKGLEYPIVMDKDAATWKTWGTQWWPCTYLIDKQGVVRYRWDGELNWKNTKGEAMLRKRIEALLAEPGPKPDKSKKTAKKTENSPVPTESAEKKAD